MRYKHKYEFKYKGNSSFIDLNTLLISQFQYLAMLNGIKDEIDPNKRLNIKIEAFQPGSFNVNQVVEIVAASSPLLALFNMDTVKQIFEYLKGIIELKRLLGDSKADSVESVDNQNVKVNCKGNGNSLTVNKNVYNFYVTNTAANSALNKSIEALEKDEEIEGFEVTDIVNNQKIIDIPRSDFPMLTKENPYLETQRQVIVDTDAQLSIVKLDFSEKKSNKWDFIYNGVLIKAVTISDDKFLSRARSGEKFGCKDKLKVCLKIVQKFDPQIEDFINDKYEVTNVIDVIHKKDEIALF